MSFAVMLANPRRTASLVAATAILLLMLSKWAGGPDRSQEVAPAVPPAQGSERSSGIEATAAATPGSRLDELPSRDFPRGTANPFLAPSPEPTAPRPQAAQRDASAPVPAPQAPPLPFTYLGRIRSGGTTTVFLARQNRESVAQVGDILDDTYRVEKIDDTRMLFVYLPLGTQQSLPLAGEGAMVRAPQPGGSLAQTPATQDQASLLRLDAPEQVSMGQEFVVNLSLLGGRRASVGVVFDPNVLSAIRRPAPGESTLPDRGRVLVEVVGPGFAGGAAAPAAVRFRVIGAAPATTQIQLEDLTTTHDSDLASLTVPAPRRIFVSSAASTP